MWAFVEPKKPAKKAVKKETEVPAEPKQPAKNTEAKKAEKAPVKEEVEEEEKEVKKPAAKKTAKAKAEVKDEKPVAKPVEVAKPAAEAETPIEVSVEQKLVALYTLQQVDSKVDEIRAYRGNLPLEIQDLEDEIAGLETRITNLKTDSKKFQKDISDYKIKIKETEALVKKYEDQQNNVRNNREYDSLTKEIEYQNLDIQLSEKRIREATAKVADYHGQSQIGPRRGAFLRHYRLHGRGLQGRQIRPAISPLPDSALYETRRDQTRYG